MVDANDFIAGDVDSGRQILADPDGRANHFLVREAGGATRVLVTRSGQTALTALDTPGVFDAVPEPREIEVVSQALEAKGLLTRAERDAARALLTQT